MSANERRKALETEVIIENLDNEIRHILSYFKSESDLWAFLSNKNNFNIISNIADLEVYRRAVESAKDLTSETSGVRLDLVTYIEIHTLVYEIISYLMGNKGAQLNALGERLYTLFQFIRNNFTHNLRVDIQIVSSMINVLISVQKQLEQTKSPEYLRIKDLPDQLIELLRSISLPIDKLSK